VGLTVYNTRTGKKELFVPLMPGEVRMYVCGITAYDLCHVGHARSAIVFDVIRRYLAFKGYRVIFVKNFTDVDDKIIRRANGEGIDPAVVSERYIREYEADMEALGVQKPDVAPRATEHIQEMIALIERLLAGGFAYVADGDVYFEVRRFPRYGELSGKNLDELLAGARVEVDERKFDPRDFALWKAAKPGEPCWPSPWGPGRPGWHIECSAMSMKHLGESFDIHGGGADLIFPHHECEIAQSEAATGRPFVRVWIHNGFVNFGAEKMSKSLGNTLTIKELVKRHDPEALRLWLLGAHYRSPVEFAEDHIAAAARALETLSRPVHDARTYHATSTLDAAQTAPLPAEFVAFEQRFTDAMDDDFNTPGALAALFDFSRALVSGEIGIQRLVTGATRLQRLAGTLGLLHEAKDPPPIVLQLVAERGVARQRRAWKRADELREEIHRLGWTVEDTPGGPRILPRGK
jgi:cysteinyl-tRNA synthetase